MKTPYEIIAGFRPHQSFQYLTDETPELLNVLQITACQKMGEIGTLLEVE